MNAGVKAKPLVPGLQVSPMGDATKAAIVDMIREAIVSSGVTMQKAIG